jgi:signal transduction histidine kinase/ligand-binding sensor domain-containing protein
MAGPAYALDPDKRVTQYIHTAWRIQDGSAPDGMFSIAQTSDGFLWFTSASQGMYRFDGVRLLPWTLAVDGKTIDHVVSFHADHAGGLWALGEHEIFHQKGGVVTSHFALEVQQRNENISVDPDGSLWVLDAGYEIRKPLCHVTDHDVKCFGESDGLLIPNGGEALLADGKGGFWLGGQRAVAHWHEGVSEVYPIEALKSNSSDGVAALALDSEGSLWVGLLPQGPGKGLGRLEEGVFKSFVTPGFDGSKLAVFAMIVDRDGSLWVGTIGNGLFRIRGTSVEHYGRAEGLSGDSVQALYEDREGILWVTTTNGIDSFRDAAVATFSELEGLGNDQAVGVLAGRDGTIWVANGDSLDHIDKNGAVSSIRWGKGLPGDQVTAMLEDRAGNLWMGVHDGLYLFKNDRFRRIPEPDHQPLGLVLAMTEDTDGNIWAFCSGESRKLIRIRDFQVREEFPASQIPRGRIAPDLHGGIWIGPRSGGSLVLFRDGVQKSFATGSPANLPTNHLFVQADGSVLAAFDDGLVGLRQGQVQRMTTKNGLPCNAVYSFIEDKEKRWWLLAECGVVELPDSELQRWWANPEAVVRTRLYDALDGARPGRYGINSAALSPDGRVWFATGFLVQMMEPSRLSQKALPPVTYVESVTADRNVFAASDDLKLPSRLHDLQIDYTSPTFTTPQKVRFRYRLDGYDRDWHDAGTRRQAFYTDLPPGKYTFRVMACDSDGVWNESAAKLDFSIAPAYYQTNWFRALCALLFLTLLWAAYQLRVRRLHHQFETTLEARVGERTRIARELHDTLLQSFQGLLLRFQAALKVLPERPLEARQRLESALDQAAAAITEGRDAVQGLRSSASETNDLANGIIAIGKELTSAASAPDAPAIDVEVEGGPRQLNPVVRDEAYRIAGEALRNAFRHAQARRITVAIRYDRRQFRLRIRDDGKGIDEETVRRQPAKHFGLPGMRERAENVGGRLAVWSKPDAGTEVELCVPGAIAYGVSARRSWWSKVLPGNGRGNGSKEP